MIGQLVVEGLAIGACYGLLAIAVVIIYKTSEVVNFAHGGNVILRFSSLFPAICRGILFSGCAL